MTTSHTIQSVKSNTYKFPSRSVLKWDHVEFLGCFPVHTVVFDPAGTKWSRSCQQKIELSIFPHKQANMQSTKHSTEEEKPNKKQRRQFKEPNQQHAGSNEREKPGEIRRLAEII